MIKQQDIFEEQSEHYYSHKQRHNKIEQQEPSSSNNRPQSNVFILSDDVKNNVNKRLPRGFALVKVGDVPKGNDFQGQIQYVPEKRNIRVASQTLAKQFVVQTQLPQTGKRQSRAQDKGLRFGQLPQGKSKQGQKIKSIIQKFRKHQKHNQLNQHLTRLGFASAFNQIQNQNKKNIHTIESFKERTLYLLNKAYQVTAEYDKQALINEMIDQLQFLVQNAQKSQFSNSLFLIQKSIDKITREMSQIRQTGSYYFKRKKRSEKNYDQKQILYLSDLIRQLPQYALVGVIQIIQEKPFSQLNVQNYTFELNMLKHKKIREIEYYVRKKLSNFYKSREKKMNKIKSKKEMKKEKMAQKYEEYQRKEDDQFKGQMKEEDNNDLEFIFQNQELRNKGSIFQNQDIDSFSINSYHHMPDPLNSQQNDDIFNAPSRRSSYSRHSQMEFEPIPPVPSPKVEPEPQVQDFDSDSSYITDEQDSDF